MAALTLTLFGRPQIAIAGQPVTLTSQKAQALFFYLAMTREVHSRQALAGLFWSDMAEQAARRNLRVELLKVRNELADYLLVTRETIALNRNSDCTVDVHQFETLLRGGDLTFPQLVETVQLYRGEFLADFHLRDASLFEEWLTGERERLWQLARQAMLQLVEHYSQRQRYQEGIELVASLLKMEPWLEEAHQQQMRLLALTGQRSAALAHYETASAILDDEFGVPPSDETNALYDRIEQGEFDTATPSLLAPTVPVAPPFQAPLPPLHFVGRDAELRHLRNRLTAKAGKPTVALVGMAGVGKSTLAAKLAETLRSDFPDGILWAYIAGNDPLDILGSWAQALGYDFSALSDVENRAAALRGVLADKQILIVLDEVRSAARVRSLFVGGSGSATLLTTRDQDVAAALDATPYSLTEMTLTDGEQLLRRVLGEERVQIELDAAHELCALLQNLPLAVEIAAQRLRSRPRRRLADMAARLRNMQERLDLSISDRAVRTSFMVSWESLDQEQQRIFALLSVFSGRSFAVPALAAIAEREEYPAEDLLFALAALSLLGEEEQGDGSVRYRQHSLLADFAREQLDLLGDARQSRLRMAQYYLDFAQTHQTNYFALQPEWGNLMAGMRCVDTDREWQLVLGYAETLTPPWFTRARYTDARTGYAMAETAAQTLGDQQALAYILLHWGQACIEQYAYDEAEQLLTKALALHQQQDAHSDVAHTQYHLARIALERGRYAAANELLVASQAHFQQVEDIAGVSVTLYQQALLAYRRGELRLAEELCNRALAEDGQADLRASQLPTLRLLADIALEKQDFTEAERYCNHTLALCQQLHDRSELAAVYYSLIVVSRCQEKFDAAKEFAQSALEQFAIIGNHGGKALTLHELSRIHTALGNHELAVRSSEESLEILLAIQDRFNMVYILRQLGEAQMAAGNLAQAQETWNAAFTLAQEADHPLTEQLRMKRAGQ